MTRVINYILLLLLLYVRVEQIKFEFRVTMVWWKWIELLQELDPSKDAQASDPQNDAERKTMKEGGVKEEKENENRKNITLLVYVTDCTGDNDRGREKERNHKPG